MLNDPHLAHLWVVCMRPLLKSLNRCLKLIAVITLLLFGGNLSNLRTKVGLHFVAAVEGTLQQHSRSVGDILSTVHSTALSVGEGGAQVQECLHIHLLLSG